MAQAAAIQRPVSKQADTSSGDQREAQASKEGGAASSEAAAMTAVGANEIQEDAGAPALGVAKAGYSEDQPVVRKQEIKQTQV